MSQMKKCIWRGTGSTFPSDKFLFTEQKAMEKTEEKAIFDRATEKLDLYVPLCLEDN